MKDLLNKFYRNQGLIYKILLFLAATLVIVYLFPKSGKFQYDFQKNKPWQYDNLYAPVDFAILKTQQELEQERQQIENNVIPYFIYDEAVYQEAKTAYSAEFAETVRDSLSPSRSKAWREEGLSILEDIYQYGIVQELVNYPSDQLIYLRKGNAVQRINLGQLTQANEVEQLLQQELGANYPAGLKALFYDVLKPNVRFDESLTQQEIQAELDEISPTRGLVAKGSRIVARGEIVGENTFQILNSLKAEFESQVWSDAKYNWIVLGYVLLVSLSMLMLMLFLRNYRRSVFDNNTKVTFIVFNIVFMVVLTVLVVDYQPEFVYVVPICILPLVLKAFFDARLGLFAHVITVLLLGFIVPNSSEYMFLQIIAGIVTILTVSELYKRANLFISVGQITFIYILAYFAFYIIQEGGIDSLKWQNFGLFILCGLATLFVQPLIYVYEKLFGLISDVSLLELSDTNGRLLKELSNKAPGTFHHSLNVANLAEAAANEIAANAMLVRVGALYHDIGKMENPTYFTENQANGVNTHDDLDPKESAQIIIDHVIQGIELARKNNLPDRVIDFIRTHHGTSLVFYFYQKEKARNEEVNKADFRYPGPLPFSKETAILMMADSVEAASKSLKSPTAHLIDTLVEKIINKQMEEGQFLNATINFREIQIVKKILKKKLHNIYHLRVEYPE
ncbi:HD family phosphohydrolase [Croceiramulus getboli]|nr:HDIG domain-containing protein [Flavobacteriaceae bacterium YJPT1-3]